MLLVSRYIFKKLSYATFLLTSILVIAVWLTQSLRFLDMIVNRNVSLKGYFYLVGFLIPDLLVVILPICLFISVLFFFHKFQTDHELTIWRSTGLSHMQIASPVLFLTALIVALTFIINVYILPPSFKQFKDMEHQVRQQFSGAMLNEGRFNTIHGATIYIKQRYRSGRMEGLFLYNTKGNKPYSLFAKEGRMTTIDGHLFLILSHGFRQERDPKTGKLQELTFETLNYDLSDLTQKKETRHIRPYEKSITELLTLDDTLDQNTQTRYTAAAHVRILQPFFAFIYVLIGLNFMLTSQFSRRGRQILVFASFVCGFLFHALMIACLQFNHTFQEAIVTAYGFYILCFSALLFRLYDIKILDFLRKVKK